MRSNFQWIVLIAVVYLFFTSACSKGDVAPTIPQTDTGPVVTERTKVSPTKGISDAETDSWEPTDDTCRVVDPHQQQDTDQSNAIDTETAKAYTAAGYKIMINDAGLLSMSSGTRQIITTTGGDSTTVTTKGLDFGDIKGFDTRSVLAVISADATPLHDAVGVGNTERAQELIDAGADVNAKGSDIYEWKPMHLAAFHGQTETTQVLIDAGADVNVRDAGCSRPLHMAIASPFQTGTETMQVLIEAGADVNAKNIYKSTPLHEATRTIGNGTEKMQALIDAGADLNAQDSDGDTPLLEAVRSIVNATEKVQALIDAGADLNTKNVYGKTPLHQAAESIFRNATERMQALIDAGADLNTQDSHGDTPLHGAIFSPVNPIEKLQVLIDAGADVNTKNNFGKTPLHQAVGSVFGNETLIGADLNTQEAVETTGKGGTDTHRSWLHFWEC